MSTRDRDRWRCVSPNWIMDRRNFVQLSTAAMLAALGASRASAEEDLPWLAEVQQPPQDRVPEPELSRLLPDQAGLEQWLARRRQLQQWWLEFLGAYGRTNRPLPELEIVGEEQLEHVTRQHVRYESEPQWPVEAYLCLPRDEKTRRGAVAVFHSTVDHSIRQPAGLEGRPELALGLTLAEHGFVTLSPRNFLWPDNNRIAGQEQAERFLRQRPGSKGMAKMLYDAQIALDILAARPDVDPERLGAVGHSLGAKEVLYLAALDERVRATVSSEGGIGIPFSNWDAPWYLSSAVHAPEFQHEHHELLALVAPRAFLLIGGDSADGARSWPYIDAALPIYRLYENPPRLGLWNHQQQHSFPPLAAERSRQWLEAYM